MTTNRALIVDDSKSARFALKRMLNELSLEVDTVESAVDALEYLDSNIPDVIFMDHMMPGMDGFEAVKRIKNNPDTVRIPIMMFTSKGSDLYLSQAQALGAVGIIRKTIAPVELKESLLALGLIENIPVKSTLKVDEKIKEKTTNEKPVDSKSTLDSYIKGLRELMDDQTIELHRSMWLGIESVSNEIFNRLRSELDDKFDKIKPASEEILTEQLPSHKTSWSIYIVILLMLSIIINVVLFNNNNDLKNKLNVISENQVELYDNEQYKKANITTTQSGQFHQNDSSEFVEWAQNKTIEYPYNELALNDKRISEIEEIIRRAVEAGYTGSIELQTHSGEFCLSISSMGEHILADNNLTVADCDFIGNPAQPGDLPSVHQSLSFANYLSDASVDYKERIRFEVTTVSRHIELAKYPLQQAGTRAELWNYAAQLNNQITVKLKP